MKKLMIAAAVVCAAVAANAAAIDWSATSVKDINGTAIGSKSAEAGWLAAVTIWDSTGTTVLSETSDNTAAMSKFAASTANTFAASTQYIAQLVITDDKGNSITSEKASFTTTAATSYQINFTTGAGFDTATAKIDYTSGWVAAPEPTSGLLLLLGVAGLALRRKQK